MRKIQTHGQQGYFDFETLQVDPDASMHRCDF
jgi:hypothetical protein